ncbi:hypothetical protein FRB93_010942 [Tulasnella sp. JGI-2019a]|nr:hypothetical protein FRB93_010942 [Tulasnella sp. JGI-2019a]
MHSYNKLAVLLAAFLSSTTVLGAPILHRREVPQEHSHEQFLTSVRASLAKNNPDGISDPVFGLLGNAAAAAGQGKITNTDCLHQATADQAFTNAKAAGDVTGMTDALIYAALERNTGSVGLASVLCTAIKAVNPEIAAISQHQDPASAGAAATNKAITLELAKQIASIGGDPQQALKAGTFAPGQIGDPTAKGNSCDDANDPVGCIFTQNLLVEDATADEITAAVAGIASTVNTTDAAAAASSTDAAAASSTTDAAAAAANTAQCVAVAATTADAAATTTAAAAASTHTTASVSTSSLDLGSCSNPAITFGPGFDGRNTNSFEPENETDFNHGSALNIGVITSFICQRLGSPCNAPAATLAACAAAQTAADAIGTTGAAADTWNAAFGITSNFAAVDGSSGSATAATTTAAAASEATTAAAGASTTAAAAVASTTSTSTAALGGVLPPAVTTSGSQFCVAGNACFNSLASANERACDVQNNKCADAANAAGQKATFSVSDCNAQQATCNAAANA